MSLVRAVRMAMTANRDVLELPARPVVPVQLAQPVLPGLRACQGCPEKMARTAIRGSQAPSDRPARPEVPGQPAQPAQRGCRARMALMVR